MRFRFVLLIALSLSLQSPAQQVPSQLFNGLRWRNIGPFRGGRAVAVTGVPGGGNTFYFGAVNGGVWKTEDGGIVWTPLFDKQPAASIGAIAVAPSDTKTIYVGTGESDIRSDLASGNGVYKSIDGGQTWQFAGLRDTRQISRVLVDPHDPETVFVAALGHAYGPNEDRGVFRSTDSGATWQKILYRGPEIGAADLAMATRGGNVMFAAMWNAHRPPWSVYGPIEGPGSGLFRSRDKGTTWEQLTGNGLPSGKWGRTGVAVSPDGQRVYATIDDAEQSGLYRSDDGGSSWALINKDARLTARAWYFSCITIDPNDPDVLYIPNVAFFKLSSGGKDIGIVRGAPGGDDYHQVWIDPANSQRMVLGSDQGTTVSVDGGVTWSSWYNQPTAQFYHVTVDNDFDYHVYGAQQDSGTGVTASRTSHEEIDARDFFTVGGSESGYIAPDPKNPDVFYISGTFGTLVRFDRRLMQSQNIAPSNTPVPFEAPITEKQYRDPWTPVVVFSPVQPNALYFGTQYVMRTYDGGMHWQTISPDLTGASRKNTTSSGPPTIDNAEERGYGVVYTIAPSPLNASQLWAGSDTGLIHLTRDAGKTWSDVTPPGLTAWSKISLIEPSHFEAGEAYAAVDRHRLDDRRPYMFRTRDYGKTWQPIVDGIAESAFVRCVRQDSKRQGLLYAGTELGAYVSFDDGGHWQPLQLNLPVTSIHDMVVHRDDLVIATHGRAFWILDDVEPLRQLSAAMHDDIAFLYKPAVAYRTRHDIFLGTPLPPEEPQAPNPPSGAYIDYFLPQPTKGEVKLDILDASGQVVRHYSSNEEPPPLPKAPAIAPRWLPNPARLSNAPGMHRWIWDLRYGREGEITADDPEGTGIPTWIGPIATPGAYKVRFSVDGHTFMSPLRLEMDPRSHATEAELTAQFRWAQRAFNDLVTAGIAIKEVQAAQSSDGNSPSEPAKQLLHNLNSMKDSLTAALNAIESADRAPSSQAIQLYEDSARMLRVQLADWKALKTSLPRSPRQ